MSESAERVPVDKLQQRPMRNCLSASVMLGHLCALYDRGVWEAARLMSNLLFQLTVKKRSNAPLLEQIGAWDKFRVIVENGTLAANMSGNEPASPLVSLMWGLKSDAQGSLKPAAMWLLAAQRPGDVIGFAPLTIDAWLDDPIIPTTQKVLSRRDLIVSVRDQDGGAHSDSDDGLRKRSPDYVELVNAFPISKQSAIRIPGHTALAWDLLPPVTLPILRQIAHELLSAIFSQSDFRSVVELPSLLALFDGTDVKGAFVPEGYPDVGPIYGKQPAVIRRGATVAGTPAS